MAQVDMDQVDTIMDQVDMAQVDMDSGGVFGSTG